MKKLAITSIFSLIALLALVTIDIPSSQVNASENNKVNICHATSSQSNPYVQNQPDKSGDVDGHDGHNGGVFPANPWGDIIPPFTYQVWEKTGSHQEIDEPAHLECPTNNSAYTSNDSHKDCKRKINNVWKYADKVWVPATYKTVDDYGWVTHNYPGKNWTTAGQTIWNNACKYVAAVSPSVSTSPSVNPSVSPSVIPSTDPSLTISVEPSISDEPNCEEEENCDQTTPSVTPSEDPGEPTVSPEATVTPTDGVTPGIGGPGDGLSDGRSDGRSDGMSSTPAGSVLGTSTLNDPYKGVLGASTMAKTGTFEQNMMNLLGVFGMLFVAAGYVLRKKGLSA